MDRRRGHPRATSHDAIHTAALELFDEVGFAATTMPMIAQRSGVGRSTLFRYFSSRADILWHGYDERTDDFRAALAAQPPGVDLADGAFAAYLALWSGHPERTPIGKEVTRILEDGEPEATGRWRVYAAWADLVHEWVLDRTGPERDDTAARASAMAIWAAIWAGVADFARSDAVEIDGHLARARAAIEVRTDAGVRA